jgi:uncharacterized SAM-binding protein YcdF (DUF218 family)
MIKERGFARVLLVTSALHMPRASACFRAEGVTFDTLVVDRLAFDPAHTEGGVLPRAGALALSTVALREWSGRIVYRVMGYAKAP